MPRWGIQNLSVQLPVGAQHAVQASQPTAWRENSHFLHPKCSNIIASPTGC